MGTPRRTTPDRIVIWQAFTVVLVAAGFCTVSAEQGAAALLAGCVTIAPNAYFAWRSQVEQNPARLVVQGVMKLAMTLSLMAMAFATMRPAPLGFFAAFIAIQAVHVVGSMVTSGAQFRRPTT